MKTKTLLIVLLAFSLVLSACGAKSDLTANREKWDNQKITHYRFNLTISCFCAFRSTPVSVEVKDGQIVSMVDSQGKPIDESFRTTFEQAGTIEALFAVAEENLANADKVDIVYDSTYGFPSDIVVDRITQAVDDEISYFVENFEVLQ